MKQTFRLALCAAAGLVFSLEVETAKAGGFAVREQSAEALGEAFAGVALAPVACHRCSGIRLP